MMLKERIHHLYSGAMVFLSALVASVFPAALNADDTVSFVYFNKFEPFSWESEGVMNGIFIDAVNEIFQKRLKIKVSHHGFPWIRAQRMVEAGEADGFCTISTSERTKYSFPTEVPVIETDFKLYTGAENSRIKELKKVGSLAELEGFRLIDILGSGWAQVYLKEFDVYFERTYSRVFMLLENNRYDVSIRNSIQTRFLLNRLGFEGKIIELPQSIVPEKESYRILIGKKSTYAKYLKEINDVLREIHADGTLCRIQNKYLLKSSGQ